MNKSDIKNEQQSSGQAGEEIDLLEIGSKMWKGFKGIFSGIAGFIVAFIIFTIRKAVWVGSFALIGVLLGLFYSNIIKKPYYTSMLEGFSGGVDNTVVIDHINQLDKMVSKPEILADVLGIEVEDAEKIRLLKAFYGVDVNFDGRWDFVDERNRSDVRSQKDTLMIRVPSVFFIKIQLYDEDVLDKLRDGIFQYINKNPYIQALFEIDKQQNVAMIAELEREIDRIGKLDSIQQHLQSFSRDNRGREMGDKIYLFGSNEPELRLFYTDILSLYERKQGIERRIEIYKEPVVVVQDFVAAQWEERTQIFYIVVNAFILVIVGYAVAIAWAFRKRLRKIIMEDPIKYFEDEER